jgi:cytochrome c551/c552
MCAVRHTFAFSKKLGCKCERFGSVSRQKLCCIPWIVFTKRTLENNQGGKKVNKPIIHFIISAVLGLGIGYIAFDVIAASDSQEKEVTAVNESSKPEENAKEESESADTASTSAGEENILQAKGCLGCHSVEALNLTGGATGPDLSDAFTNVEGKHGKAIDEFLKEPTSAVMSGVIGGNPLTEEEINQVVDLLKEASEK